MFLGRRHWAAGDGVRSKATLLKEAKQLPEAWHHDLIGNRGKACISLATPYVALPRERCDSELLCRSWMLLWHVRVLFAERPQAQRPAQAVRVRRSP